MKGAIYSRVSTSLGKQSTSRQVSDLIVYAKSKGFIINEEDIYEEYISGYKVWNERPELMRLMGKIDQDNSYYSAIFVWEISRIARDPIQGNNIINYFSEKQIPIYVKEPEIVSLRNGNRDGMFTIYFTILMEFANTEALLIKKRSRSGIRDKIKEGKSVGFINLPYGYKKNDKGMLIIDDEEELTIKRIFDLSLSGYGTKKIANILNADNIKTRYNKKYKDLINFKEKQKPPINPAQIKWKDGTIYTILTNTIYKGQRKVKVNPDDKSNTKLFDYFEAPAIIDKDLWDEVQIRLSERNDTSVKNTKFIYILKDKLVCSYCGSSMFARNRSNGKDRYYMCSSKRTKARNCLNKGYSIENLDGIILDEVFRNEFNGKAMDEIQENNKLLFSSLNNLKKILKSIKDREEEVIENIENSKIAYLKDPIALEKYYFDLKESNAKELNKIIKEKESIIKKIKDIEVNVADYSNFDTFYDIMKKTEFDRTTCAKIVEICIDKIYYFSIDNDFCLISIFFKNSYITQKIELVINKKEKVYNILRQGIEFNYDNYGRLENHLETIKKIPNIIYYHKKINPLFFDFKYKPSLWDVLNNHRMNEAIKSRIL
jgi:DNA invertase Pin-like site-specific DNA recombinase